ncbi:hypothetical protein BDY21DRAFT_293448, partial [Lineolata rhizophorae]
KNQLHAHLSGSISRECLHEIWCRKKAAELDLDLEDPLVAIPPGKVDYDLHTFFPLFSSYIYKLCSDPQSIEYSTHSVLTSFEADNVVYAELRTTPRALPSPPSPTPLSPAAHIDLVLSALAAHNARPDTRLHARLILSVDRGSHDAAAAAHIVDLAIARRHAGVVGVDLGGNPARGDVGIFAAAFARAAAAGLGVAVHFGEVGEAAGGGGEAELWELLGWRPRRLGHVVHVGDEVRREVVRRGLPVELCLSCNVLAGMVEGGVEGHHFGWWKDVGVPVALATDDVGVFCSPLSNEYYLAAEHFDLHKADIKRLCLGAVGAIFGGQDEIDRLVKIYGNWEGWNDGRYDF